MDNRLANYLIQLFQKIKRNNRKIYCRYIKGAQTPCARSLWLPVVVRWHVTFLNLRKKQHTLDYISHYLLILDCHCSLGFWGLSWKCVNWRGCRHFGGKFRSFCNTENDLQGSGGGDRFYFSTAAVKKYWNIFFYTQNLSQH